MRTIAQFLRRRRVTLAVPQPAINPRSDWADAPPTGPLHPEEDVRFLLTHHTGSRNNYTLEEVPGILRTIYGNHTGDYGPWSDIAYNFMVDKFGGIWEGRAGSLDGAVRGDATAGSQGHAILGCWLGNHKEESPTPEAVEAMTALWAWQASLHKIDVRPGSQVSFTSRGSSVWPEGSKVTTKTIAGHRDMSDTTCPGDVGYSVVQNLQGAVTRFIINAQ